MTATITEARDSILSVFKSAFDANVETQNIPVEYDDRTSVEDHDANSQWARVTVKHNPNAFGQASLSGEVGTKRFKREGFIIIQIFNPVNKGMVESDIIVQILLDAFEGKDTLNGIWFFNVGAEEIGVSAAWNQVNVKAEFIYDQIK